MARGRLLAIAAMVTPKGAHGYSWSNKRIKPIELIKAHFPWFSSPSAPRGRVKGQCACQVSDMCHRGTSRYCPTYRRIGSFLHSYLSPRIESGFVLRWRESDSLRSGIIPQTAGELLPPLGHISSVPSRSARILEVIGWSCHRGCQNGHAWSCRRRCRKEHCQRVCGA